MLQTKGWKGIVPERALFVFLIGLTLFLCTHNLETYPPTWWDEGKFVQIPTNVVLHGKYATQSSEGFRMFSVYGTGPAVFLPMAAAFRLFGIGLLQARWVMVGFTLLAVVAFYSLTEQLYNRRVALAAAFLLVLVVYDPFTSLLYLGRQVLGEVPAFFYLMAGCLVWVRKRAGTAWSALVLSGFLWGLSALAKWIFVMVVPCLVVLWVADRVYFHRLRHRHFLVPMLVLVVTVSMWFGYMVHTLGVEGFAEIMVQTQDNSSSNVFFLSFESIWGVTKFFVRARVLVWAVPGIAYVLLLNVSQRKKLGAEQWFLPVFAGGWLVWYAFLSLGWSRQAFAPLAISNLFLAKLLHDLSEGFSFSVQELLPSIRDGRPGAIQHFGIGLMLLGLLCSSPLPIVREIVGEQDTSAQEFAQYMIEHIPQDVVIESYEYELDILTHHMYHHPPEPLITLATKHVYSGEPYPPGTYDFEAFEPAYLIIGPFATWTGIYPSEFVEQRCTLVKSVGEYHLYRVNFGG